MKKNRQEISTGEFPLWCCLSLVMQTYKVLFVDVGFIPALAMGMSATYSGAPQVLSPRKHQCRSSSVSPLDLP